MAVAEKLLKAEIHIWKKIIHSKVSLSAIILFLLSFDCCLSRVPVMAKTSIQKNGGWACGYCVTGHWEWTVVSCHWMTFGCNYISALAFQGLVVGWKKFSVPWIKIIPAATGLLSYICTTTDFRWTVLIELSRRRPLFCNQKYNISYVFKM